MGRFRAGREAGCPHGKEQSARVPAGRNSEAGLGCIAAFSSAIRCAYGVCSYGVTCREDQRADARCYTGYCYDSPGHADRVKAGDGLSADRFRHLEEVIDLVVRNVRAETEMEYVDVDAGIGELSAKGLERVGRR